MSNLIWDSDGTLIDSYDVIVKSLHQLCFEIGVEIDPSEIRQIILKGSIGDLYVKVSGELNGNVDIDFIRRRYKEISDCLYTEIKPMNGVIETLEELTKRGHRNFVFTHRDNLTFDIFKHLKMDKYFEEVVTCEKNLGWKPNPGGVNYLLEKYALEKDKSYYVGDRILDIECGYNAGIGTILFKDENSFINPCGKETYVVKSLIEILDIKLD